MSEHRVSKIRKRDGRIVQFEVGKISNAVGKAFRAVGEYSESLCKILADEVATILDERFAEKVPSVEDVQDVVEEVLIKRGYDKVAKAYILYRKHRTQLREAKKFLGVEDDLKLSVNAISVLERRYLRKDEHGKVIETPSQMFRRVARAIALADLQYNRDITQLEEDFYHIMANLEFLPNSPTLMNAGTDMGQLSACFVIPVEDSLPSIFEAVKNMALIHQSGGGTGFSFSNIRPKGDMVRSTQGIASGPVSFMRVFDVATEVIKQGGRRRGANMGILRVDHPDIIEFITSKSREGILSNFNISVALTDDFLKRVQDDLEYDLVNPRNGEVVNRLKASDIFDLIVTMAWSVGDPGAIFIDEINRRNPTPHIGSIESTNPCGEQPLLPYESCNLGSINLSKMVKNGEVDWRRLEEVTYISTHFLDNVIDVNRYPLSETNRITRANRKIGLGVMGFAEMLIKLGIRYDSDEALKKAEEVMGFISEKARESSIKLAEERGSFPNFKGSTWEKNGYRCMRNATLTTVAPTGTISIIAGCSSGIEPIFAVSFVRNVLEGAGLVEVNPLFEETAKSRGFYSEELMREVAKTGSVQEFSEIPDDVKRLFVTAFDIAPEWHVKIQAAFQRHVDNAVSKTVNLRRQATIEDVRRVFILAHKLKCKGITVYRYGSKKEQVLYLGSMIGERSGETSPYVTVHPEYSGGCPEPYCNLY